MDNDDPLSISYEDIVDIDRDLILRSDGTLSCFKGSSAINSEYQEATPDVTNEIPICNKVKKLLHNGFFITENDYLCYWNTENYTIIDRNFKELYYKPNYANYIYGNDEIIWIDKSNNLHYGNEEEGWKVIATDVKNFIFGPNLFFYESNAGDLYFSHDINTERTYGLGYVCKTNNFTLKSLEGIKAINYIDVNNGFIHALKENGNYQILGTDYEVEDAEILMGEASCIDLFSSMNGISETPVLLKNSNGNIYWLNYNTIEIITSGSGNPLDGSIFVESWNGRTSNGSYVKYLGDADGKKYIFLDAISQSVNHYQYELPEGNYTHTICNKDYSNMYQISHLEDDFQNYKLPVQYSSNIDEIEENLFVAMGNNIFFVKDNEVWYCYYSEPNMEC